MKKIHSESPPEDAQLFDHLNRLLTAIADDALELVAHLNEGIQAFRTQAIILVSLAVVLTAFTVPAFITARAETPEPLSYYALGMYTIFIVMVAWFAVRTMMSYSSYRTRYSRMMEAAKEFSEARKAKGRG
jgi:hypothetical protein